MNPSGNHDPTSRKSGEKWGTLGFIVDPEVYSCPWKSGPPATNFLGALTGVTFGSADSDNFSYDPKTGRLKTYTFNVNGKTDTGTLTWNTNGTLGKLVISDLITSTSDSQTCTYSYDDLQRVSGASCGAPWSQTFTYDPFGNITKSGTGSFTPGYVFSTGATTNQYFSVPGVSVSYDKNGNLLTDNLNTYTWDQNWGVPVKINSITAVYDALGGMVEQQNGSTNIEILISPIGKTALMNARTLTKAFIPLPGGATAVYTSSGLTYYRHSDWLGSSRLASTQARALHSSTAYAPFGEQYANAGTPDASFTGQNSDTITSLYDFTFREHSPSQGRWISPDPLGVGAADVTDPQTWNRYGYVSNGPLNSVDPLGLVANNQFIPEYVTPCGWYSCIYWVADAVGGGGGWDGGGGWGGGGVIGGGGFGDENICNPDILPCGTSLGSGNPITDIWQDALGLPTLPCQGQFGPWCDPSMLPDPWVLDWKAQSAGDCALAGLGTGLFDFTGLDSLLKSDSSGIHLDTDVKGALLNYGLDFLRENGSWIASSKPAQRVGRSILLKAGAKTSLKVVGRIAGDLSIAVAVYNSTHAILSTGLAYKQCIDSLPASALPGGGK